MKELKAKVETEAMVAIELRIELLFEALAALISGYDVRYGHSKDMPLLIHTHLEGAKTGFQKMKHDVRHGNPDTAAPPLPQKGEGSEDD